MKTFAIILLLGFTWQVSNAFIRPAHQFICLLENGFTDVERDIELVRAIADPENADRLKDVLNEKMASVFACMFQRQYGNQNLTDNTIKGLIQIDDKVMQEERKKMLETLTTCNTNAAGDNTKLLTCLKIISPPFDLLIATIRDIQGSVGGCFPKCEITLNEMYKMDESRGNFQRLLEIVNEQRFGCFLGCIVDEETKKKPGSSPLLEQISNLINKSEKHDENQKKEMLETINRCDTQVAAKVKDRSYELIKCLNLFKPPFVDLE